MFKFKVKYCVWPKGRIKCHCGSKLRMASGFNYLQSMKAGPQCTKNNIHFNADVDFAHIYIYSLKEYNGRFLLENLRRLFEQACATSEQ